VKRMPPALAAALLTPAACAPPDAEAPPREAVAEASGDEILARAFAQRRSDFTVEAEGVVTRILADDRRGSRHQRFLIQLASGQTLLIAHNIDLAPRVADLKPGDRVRFLGEYEWGERGGTIHWTHRDDAGDHVDGWLEHRGRRYD
jgi:hypothetical protein